MQPYLITDALTPTAAASIFPCPPLRSSQPLNWAGIYLEYHQQPAYETPEYCYSWHVIGLHLGTPVTVDMQSLGRKIVVDGDVYLFPAHCWQQVRCHHGSEFVDIHLSPHLFRQFGDEFDPNTIHFAPYFAVRDPLIQQLCLTLKRELEVASASVLTERLYAESLAQALAAHLLRHYTSQDTSQAMSQLMISQSTSGLPAHLLKRVIAYINQHLQQELSVETIAALTQLSPYHFSRLFKQATGLSPYQYILHCRINSAKQLLQQRSLSISDIAHSVGFVSQSHFHRHFKRIVGVTPRQFRSL